MALTGGFFVAEVIGGLMTDSLALLADAGHMLTDVGGLGLAWFATRFASKPATPEHTYGFYRAEILAAVANAVVLLGISGFILVEAYGRFRNPPAVATWPMLAIAVIGLIERAAVVGQLLDPATPAFRIGNLSTLWLTVHAFERDAVRIRPGVAAQLAFSALPGVDFTGAVAVVGQQVDRESRTVPVRINVRNRETMLRPGMSATATLPVGASNAALLTVPVAAVQRVRNEWCVFLPKDARHFEIRRIGRGRDLGNEVEVLSGLRPDEQIVVDGAFLLKAQAERGNAEHDEH